MSGFSHPDPGPRSQSRAFWADRLIDGSFIVLLKRDLLPVSVQSTETWTHTVHITCAWRTSEQYMSPQILYQPAHPAQTVVFLQEFKGRQDKAPVKTCCFQGQGSISSCRSEQDEGWGRGVDACQALVLRLDRYNQLGWTVLSVSLKKSKFSYERLHIVMLSKKIDTNKTFSLWHNWN